MHRARPTSVLVTAALALAAIGAKAQSAAPSATSASAAPASDTANSPVFTPPPAAPLPALKAPASDDDDHGDPRRIQSAELANALVNSLPHYDPPKPVALKTEEPEADLRDADKPKNGIVRLPKYVVHATPPPIFTEKDVMTEKARKELAMKQYIIDTKDMPSFAAAMAQLLFQANASQQYADAERLGNIASLSSDASAAALSGDKAESDFIRAQSNDTYLRRTDWAPIGSGLTTSSSPGPNGGGDGR